MSRDVIAYIDTSALQHNFRCVRQLVGVDTRILSMIKANAYGHGLLPVASALSDSDAFGVATIDSAMALRQQGVDCPIVLMQGFSNVAELEQCLKHNLTPVIHHLYQVSCLSQYKLPKPLNYWLKLDSGMHRLGIADRDFSAAFSALCQQPNVDQDPVIMTHLASADDRCKMDTLEQLSIFNKLLKDLSNQRSVCNSAAILAYPSVYFDWVRPGIMLYGVSPFIDRSASDFDLKPVMTLKASLVSVRQQKQTDRIGYGGTFRCPRDMLVGVVNIGYGDGYPRSVKSGTPVLIHGVSCPILGRVSMDMISVDLSALSYQPDIGAEVILWGRDLPVEVIARCAGTIGYELLTQLTTRVRSVYSCEQAIEA